LVVPLVALLVLAAIGGCRRSGAGREGKAPRHAASDTSRARAESQYELLQASLQLAQKDKPYLVFDWSGPAVDVMLKGAVVAHCPMRVDGSEAEVRRFRVRFRDGDDRVLRGLVTKRLYTAQKQTPDSILSVVGPILNLDPAILQRHIPGWFELDWGEGLVLEVHADVAGQPMPGADLRRENLRRVLKKPFGDSNLRVTMDRRDALTIFRVAHTGFPTLSPAY
jgi:hypothetical protein